MFLLTLIFSAIFLATSFLAAKTFPPLKGIFITLPLEVLGLPLP